jgi:protein-tyrosine phosphatase
MTDEVPAAILFVCTGNICRSPMAERLLIARIPPGPSSAVRASSAGLRAVVGYPMDPVAARVLRALGGDPDGHVARQLHPDMVSDADLVLTADAEQRSRIVREQPRAMRRVFTLREFGRLGAELDVPNGTAHVEGDSAAAMRERVAEVAALRGWVDPVAPSEDDIGDPFGAPLPVMQACGRAVFDAVADVAAVLGLGERA